jgi:hypothetical protein
VTPPYKEGHPVLVAEPDEIAADGSHVIGVSLGVFGGTEDDPPGESNATGAIYEFSRSQGGWATKPLVPPASQFAEDSFGKQLVSADFGTTTFVLNTASEFVQQRDLYLRRPDGSFLRVGPMTPPGVSNNNDAFPEGGSTDLSHVLFYLDQTRWPGDTTVLPVETTPSLYEAIAGSSSEEPKLVGVKNEGPLASNLDAQLVSNCGTELGGGGEITSVAPSSHSVSASGRTVIFTAHACEGTPSVNELFARLNESKTVAVSEPVSVPGRECTGVCKKDQEEPSLRSEGLFQGASVDGSKVFFTTAQPLLDGDTDTTPDLYEAEITDAGVQKLIQVSRGDGSDATPGTGARVLGVAAISSDGSRVYFAAEGVLTTIGGNQGGKAIEGVPNLYMAEPASGRTTFITTLLSTDNEDWLPGSQSVKATPDGRYLVFGSAGALVEYDANTGVLAQIASNGGGSRVSNDGSYVFFTSSAALAPGALSGRSHVYEYHGGQVSLISDGQDAQGEGARLLGIDASGGNVFFETVDSLVAQDSDSLVDVYDARIGGGFPAPASSVGCAGDGCRVSSNVPPALAPAYTASHPGGENAATSAGVKVGPAHLTRAQRLARALKECNRRSRKRRAACVRLARKKYGLRAKKGTTVGTIDRKARR